MSERWWRAKNSAVHNRKLQKLPGDLFKAWFNVNCLASEHGGVVPPIEDVAFALRLSEQRAAAILTQLAAAKLLDKQDGVFIPHDWDQHQFKSDKKDPTAPERMKRYRDRKRNGVTAVTVRNESNDAVSAIRPEAETESETEQSRADGRVLDEIGLKQEGLLKAAFIAECADRPKAPDMAIIKTWLLDGITVGTISKTVPAILRRKVDMASLSYCDKAVREAHASAQAAPSLEPVPLSDSDWRSTVKRYKDNRSQWSRHAGPEPGMAGCRAPVQVLVDASIDPSSGLDMDDRWSFVSEGTVEMAAFIHDAQCRKVRPPRMYEVEIGGVVKRGFHSRRALPAGYDEATGEKLPPKAEDAA
jgi:hypothetical protein